MLVSGVGDICIIDGGGGQGRGGGCTHTIWRNEQTSKLKKSSNTIICVLGLVCVNVCVCMSVCGMSVCVCVCVCIRLMLYEFPFMPMLQDV